jgi:restriction system protein
MIWKIFSRLPAKFKGAEDYASECYKRNLIALGWNELGDVSQVASRKALRDKVQSKYGSDARSAAQAAGSIWSFYHEVRIGDYVLCPDKKSRRVYIGQVTGGASYEATETDATCRFANRRKMDWLITRKGLRKQTRA